MSIFSKLVEWDPGYYPDISQATSAQRRSYEKIKKTIENGNHVECSDAYLYAYSYELNQLLIQNTSLVPDVSEGIYKKYRNFVSIYSALNPKVAFYFYPWMIVSLVLAKADIRSTLEEYMEFYIFNKFSGNSEFITALYVSCHQIESSADKVEGRLFQAFVGEDLKQYMTSTGRKHHEDVMQVIDVLLQGDFRESGINYLYRMYDFEAGFIMLDNHYNLSTVPKKSAYTDNVDLKLIISYPTYKPSKKKAFIKRLVYEAENLVRENKGLQRIGEGWVSETLLFRQIESAFNDTEVVQHANPSFLDRQHYDVYLPEHKIALEYQGDQHFRPIEFFGGEEAFAKNQERDRKKATKSHSNGVFQIDVTPGYDLNSVIRQVASHIYNDVEQPLEDIIKNAVKRANNMSLTTADLSVSESKALDAIASVGDEAELSDYRYELKIKKLVNAKRKSPAAGEDFMKVPEDRFRIMIDKLEEVKRVSKSSPEESNILAFELMDFGYHAPAIYTRVAINYRKMNMLNEELDTLIQAKKDFDYNFDDRIKSLLKKMDR